MTSIESLREDIRRNVTVWKRYRDKGGSDPFWTDGDNMNLCRNHIIDDRRRIEEIITTDGIEPPAELLIPVPPKYPRISWPTASMRRSGKGSAYPQFPRRSRNTTKTSQTYSPEGRRNDRQHQSKPL